MNEEKIERVLKTLNHEGPDRVLITEWFWDEFVQRWKTEKGLDEDTDIYGSKEEVKKEALMKLKVAREGGWIGSSSESVGGDVSVGNYECFVQVVRKYGTF
jgi:hypothetical protein